MVYAVVITLREVLKPFLVEIGIALFYIFWWNAQSDMAWLIFSAVMQ